MMCLARFAYFLSIIASTAHSSIILIGCNQGTQQEDLNAAVDDVMEVATGKCSTDSGV
jgi:hypothetical protein